ncbi:hypothetical protein HDU99_005219 [Rhizoclosmatium hyalinum]|nr:hypothetical protein HDU99_005219 [Rhizoclosmatium hyalinum]
MSELILLQLLADMNAMKASHSEEMLSLKLEMNAMKASHSEEMSTMKTSNLRSEERQNGIIQGLRYDVDSIKVDLDLCSKRVEVLMARCSDNVNEIQSLRLEGKGLFRELEEGAKESDLLKSELASEEDARDFLARECGRMERHSQRELAVATSQASVAKASTERIRKDLLGCHASLQSAKMVMDDTITCAKNEAWQQSRFLADRLRQVHHHCQRHNFVQFTSLNVITATTSCPVILESVGRIAESWDMMFRCLMNKRSGNTDVIDNLANELDHIFVKLNICAERVDFLMKRSSKDVNEIHALRVKGKGLVMTLEVEAKESDVLKSEIAREEDAREFISRCCGWLEKLGEQDFATVTARTCVALAGTESIRKDLLGCHASLQSAKVVMNESITLGKKAP